MDAAVLFHVFFHDMESSGISDRNLSRCFLKVFASTHRESLGLLGRRLNNCDPLKAKLLQYLVFILDEGERIVSSSSVSLIVCGHHS